MAQNKDIPDIASFGESWEGHTGAQVEKFIKDTLASKAGCFYLDEDNDRYLVFASEETRDEYLEDTSKAELVLGVVTGGGGSGGGYNLNVNLLSDYYMTTLPGDEGSYIEFTFDITNNAGLPANDDVLVTYTFRWNSVVRTVTQKYVAGQRARFAVDDYVGDSGITNISVRITGVTTLVSTSFAVVYSRVDLKLTDSFRVGNYYNLITNPGAVMEIPFTIVGLGVKTMEWYIDGVKMAMDKETDEITEQSSTRTKFINVNELAEGVHSVQFRAYMVVNGENFYSQTIYREFVVYRAENNSKTLIMIGAELNVGDLVTTGTPLKLSNITQYLPYTIKIGIFSPANIASNPIEIYLGSALQSTIDMANDDEQEYTFIATDATVDTITLKHATNTRVIPIEIEKSSSSLTEIISNLSLSLKAIGKTNSSSDRNTWTYNSITTAFTGFKWTEQSGWYDNRLVMSDGAGIAIKHSPLSGDSTTTGKTLEFEFATSNVVNDDAVICDLRNGNTGLLITASEASLTSASGTKVSVKYKAEENIRIAFVINPRAGVTNKQLVFIYVNGILSGAANYASSDNFRVSKELSFISSEDVTIRIKELRFYDTALSADQILNNYTLYRDTVAEMLRIYDRNNIYTEGSSEFSTDILSSQLPIVIVTGNIPALEATTDKNLQIEVDVEYINIQDSSLSFKMEKAALRPQGTSSMSYPKKNFRLYTNKLADTVLYDSNGNVVPDKLYSFRKGAQPVNCWCFKADYAESSGTHNTGIARLWNNAMKNAQIAQEYRLRTDAQKAAIQNGYEYDVRTTIDGFPVLMFYRLNANSPLVFIGKYNFNNDKSTESVFGFRDIPGFNASHVQCWEVLNNGHHLALFQDVNNWNVEWSDAFEGRYPDGNTDTTDLKSFANWMSAVTPSNFKTQKWEHLDVYKVAAYYVYLMRFGAVDQVVKNAMFTTEDGAHWFYINYDNDTINGLRNDGLLIYPPTIDRQSLDTSFSSEVYAYAGHDSRLWNLLEGDTEFMQIVADVDSALYTAGLSYANVIKEFDEEQSDKWCERIYNQDSQYKYIGPYNNNSINNLFMLQGSRQSHRRYWLSRRFSWIDSKFVSGAYKDNVFEVKLAGAPIGLQFSIVAGFYMNYGYGVNNVPIQYGIVLDKNASHTFTTQAVLNVGDPLRIYAAPNIKEIDIHSFRQYLTQISIAGVFSSDLGTKLEKLILGDASTTGKNTSLSDLSGIASAKYLKYLDIRGFEELRNLDLSQNTVMETLLAQNSGLTSLTLPSSSVIKELRLPASMTFLTLRNLTELATANFTVENNGWNISDLTIANCPQLDVKAFVDKWYTNKLTADADCSLTLEGINWTGMTAAQLLKYKNLRSVSFKGRAEITSATVDELNALKALYGDTCFSPGAQFYIKAPAGAYLLGPDSLSAGQSAVYECVYVGEVTPTRYEYSLTGSGIATINAATGALIVRDNFSSDTDVTVTCRIYYGSGVITSASKTVKLIAIIYPTKSNSNVSGDKTITARGEKEYKLNVGSNVNGEFTVQWSLTGIEPDVATVSGSDSKCTLNVLKIPLGDVTGAVVAKVYKTDGTLVSTFNYPITIIGVLMTSESNPEVMSVCYAKGWAASPTEMTVAEAAAVTDIGDAFLNTDIKHFDEFEKFTGVTSIGDENGGGFGGCAQLRSLKLPSSLKTIKKGAFVYIATDNDGETPMSCLEIPASVTSIQSNAFILAFIQNIKILGSKTYLEKMVFESCGLKSISGIFITDSGTAGFSSNLFNNAMQLETVEILNTGLYVKESAFYGCISLKNIDFSKINNIEKDAFYRSGIENVELTDSSVDISLYAFSQCQNLKTFKSTANLNLSDYVFQNSRNLNEIQVYNINTCLSGVCIGCTRLEKFTMTYKGGLVGRFGDSFFSGCLYLKDIYIYRATAPSLGENSFGRFDKLVDSNNIEHQFNNLCLAGLLVEGPKTLHVPANATGYDEGDWVDVLLNPEKCGFTLVKDLL